MKTDSEIDGAVAPAGPDIGEVVLSDQDIVEAMAHIPGYLDISTEDFRALYHLAHQNALDHLTGKISARKLSRADCRPLSPDMTMDRAAVTIADSGYKGLPVVEASGRVVGMLTETDFLRRLKANTFLELMLRLLVDVDSFSHRCHETRVAEVMTAPAVTVRAQADFREILAAFRDHSGRGMPVVDDEGRLLGILLRKDFLKVLDAWLHRD